MLPELLEIVGPIVGLTTVGIMVLIGMKLRYSHLRDTRSGSIASQEVEHLAETVGDLRDEVRLLRQEYAGLNERVEFTERLLERPRGGSA